MAPELFANSSTPGQTTSIASLSQAITTSPAQGTAESWAVSQAAPSDLRSSNGQFRVLIESEIMIVTASATGVSPWTFTRGAEGTIPSPHASGTPIYHILTRGGLLNALASLNAVVDRQGWTAATNYSVHDLVEYGGTTWLCATAHTSGSTFDETKFTELNDFRGVWLANTRYVSGDIVINSGSLFSANSTFTSTSSFVSANWTLLAGGAGSSTTVQGTNGANLGSAVTVDFASTAKEIFLVGTLSANLTITFANRVAGSKASLFLTQDVTGNRTVTVSDGTNNQLIPSSPNPGDLTVTNVACLNSTDFDVVPLGGGGMQNPMTTAGDQIVGGASGTPTRVAVGSNGQVWTVVGGTPAWAAATGGSSAFFIDGGNATSTYQANIDGGASA